MFYAQQEQTATFRPSSSEQSSDVTSAAVSHVESSELSTGAIRESKRVAIHRRARIRAEYSPCEPGSTGLVNQPYENTRPR